ncbi:MAG: hypothetical protein ACRETL_03630 [Gammaproteobacteria bacterium]
MPKQQSIDPTIVDAASLFDASEAIAERVGRSKVTIDYKKLRECLDSLRKQRGWKQASPNTLLLSIDPNSEGQRRFQEMLRHSDFEVDVVHFRDTFVSVPPGRSPNEMTGRPIVSLASRMGYVAGLMARYEDPNLLVVSHGFELFAPLTDLRRRKERGRVGIAYFGSLLDYRWKLAGLFDDKLDLEFFDLDPHSDELLGVDLGGRASPAPDSRTGLSRF